MTAGGPLAGVRVADFSRLLPGPWAANLLGALGADVIKVEAPGTGDPSRHNPPFYATDSVYFDSVNCNKRSIAVDLKNQDGLKIAHDLLGASDVVIESFRPGAADRLGVGYAKAGSLNPAVVYASLSGFGATGPLAHVPGHDLAVQALSGLMGVDGRAFEAMEPPAFQAADYAAALFACVAIMAALMEVRDGRKGRYLEISMLDSLVALSGIAQLGALARRAGVSGQPGLQAWGRNPRYATYATADGRSVAVCLLEKETWRAFCRHIRRPDLIREDEAPGDRHSSHGALGDAYRAAIAAYCASLDVKEHMRVMREDGLPIAPMLTPDEALASDLVGGRGMVADLAYHDDGQTRCRLNDPLVRSGLAKKHAAPAPGLGEHADEILQDLGYDEKERRRLIESGAVG